MILQDGDFPQRHQLWRGAILATIAHTISVTRNPTLAYELSWEGPNYSRQDSQGTRGTITFADDRLVGVFRDDASPRAPWNAGSRYSLAAMLAGMPDELVQLAQREALQYVLDEYDGVTEPIITAALWSDGDAITAAEPWADVVAHGAHLVRIEAMETEAAMSEWQTEYEWSEAQTALLRRLFERKMALPGARMMLENTEYDQLVADGRDGLAESRELLAAIGIELPKRRRSK